VSLTAEKEAHAATRAQLVKFEAIVAELQARLGEGAGATAATPTADAGVDKGPHLSRERGRTTSNMVGIAGEEMPTPCGSPMFKGVEGGGDDDDVD